MKLDLTRLYCDHCNKEASLTFKFDNEGTIEYRCDKCLPRPTDEFRNSRETIRVRIAALKNRKNVLSS